MSNIELTVTARTYRELLAEIKELEAQADALKQQMIRELRRMGGLLKHLSVTGPDAAEEIRETLTSIRQAIERLAART